MAHFEGPMFRLKSLFKLWRRGPASPYDAVLRQIPLFHTLNQRERGLVELILHERTYVAGELIWEEGEEGLGMYIILEGQVKVVRKGIAGKRELGTLAVGESFGELSLLEGGTRTVGVIAAESPTRLLSLFRPELLRLMENHSRIGHKLCYELACGLARRYRTVLDREPGRELLE